MTFGTFFLAGRSTLCYECEYLGKRGLLYSLVRTLQKSFFHLPDKVMKSCVHILSVADIIGAVPTTPKVKALASAQTVYWMQQNPLKRKPLS